MRLALDTSTLMLTLALVERLPDGGVRVVEDVRIGPPQRQSEVLPGAVGELLARHGVALAALEGLVVGLGPGSFTGLRIGLACAKGLAYAAGLPVAGGSSLAALALEGPEGVPLYCLAVARKDELYLGRYRREGARGVVALGPEEALTPEAVAERLRAEPEAVVLGPALTEYGAVLERAGVAAERLLAAPRVPSAVALAQLVELPEKGAQPLEALFGLEPHYVKASSPELDPKFPPLPGPAPGARRTGE